MRITEADVAPLSAFLRALDEEVATDDALNVLVLQEGLSWREVELLRTLRNHLLQVRTHYNAETVNGVLLRNSGVAASLFRSFAARFDPSIARDRDPGVAAADAAVKKALEAVGSLAEDEVLRGIDNLIRAGAAAQQAAGAAMPLQRVGQPEEVAAAVVWLCSEASGFITGTTLTIDGGKLAGTPPFQVKARRR